MRFPSASISRLVFHRQPTETGDRSLMPIETTMALPRAAARSAATSGPGTSIEFAARRLKKSWLLIGACTEAHTGNPGKKDSGKAMSRAPARLASAISAQALSTVAGASRNTGAT